MTIKQSGKIIIPKQTLIHSHEQNVARTLVKTGEDVQFLPTSIHHTADIAFRGLEWEIKSPIGNSSRTIENNLRNALKQSRNVIINLGRIKQSEDKCIKEIRRQAKLLHQIKRIIIITKNNQIIELS